MSNPHLDARTSGEIFRADHPIILALNRHLATILPVRLAYVSGGYVAGQVLARNTVTGYFQKYDSGGASGTDTARAVLFESADPVSGDTMLARGIFGGWVFESKLIDLDNDAKTDLKATSIIDASGVTVLKF